MSGDEDLRRAAAELVARRERRTTDNSESLPPRSEKHKRTPVELAKAAVAPGAGLAGLIAIAITVLQSRVSPEQLKALQQRVDSLEEERSARRLHEFERDKVNNCRMLQTESAVRSMLPRPDSQAGYLPKPWFDKCPELVEPTTGSRAAK